MSGDRPLVIDLDATLITSHSEKQWAASNFKRGFGFHPLGSWVDHGAEGTGEPLSMTLRRGNAGSNTGWGRKQVTRVLYRTPGRFISVERAFGLDRDIYSARYSGDRTET